MNTTSLRLASNFDPVTLIERDVAGSVPGGQPDGDGGDGSTFSNRVWHTSSGAVPYSNARGRLTSRA